MNDGTTAVAEQPVAGNEATEGVVKTYPHLEEKAQSFSKLHERRHALRKELLTFLRENPEHLSAHAKKLEKKHLLADLSDVAILAELQGYLPAQEEKPAKEAASK